MSRRWILFSIVSALSLSFVACGSSSPKPSKAPQSQPASSTSVNMQGIDDDIPPPLDVDDEEH